MQNLALTVAIPHLIATKGFLGDLNSPDRFAVPEMGIPQGHDGRGDPEPKPGVVR